MDLHLKGYGWVKVFKRAVKNGSIEYWATNDLEMSLSRRYRFSRLCWKIEEYHRGIKQFVGIERSQVRSNRAQRNHIGLALRAFLRLERYCFRRGLSWFEAKIRLTRPAVRVYLENPLYQLTA